jgi:DNA ligase 1
MKYSNLCKVYKELEESPSRLKKTEIISDFLKKLKKEDKDIIYLLQGKVFPDYSTEELGISDRLCIKALVKASGETENKIIERWKKIGDLGEVAEQEIQKKKQGTLFSTNLTTDKVVYNLRKLPTLTGDGTVERKISLISELLTSAEGIEAKYIIRTLLNDLRIGIGAGTMRDSIVKACFPEEKRKEAIELVQSAYDKTTDFALVFEKASVSEKELVDVTLSPGKPLKVMLYLKEKTIEDGFARVGKPCLIDYKYDGFRMVITKTKENKIKIFTRRLDEVTNQFPEVVKYIKEYVKGDSFIIDSEAVGFDSKTKKYLPFQSVSQRIKRKYHIEELSVRFPIEVNVFDILYYNNKNLLKTPLKERRKIIEKIVPEKNFKIKPSEAIITDDLKKAKEFYEKALLDGEEGVMMKDLNAPYKPGARVGFGVKVKPLDNEFDLVIIKGEYGTGKRAGWLTSFTVACKNRGELLEIGKVSTGLKEKEEEGLSFKELTKKLKPLIKSEHGRDVEIKPEIVVTVIYQNIQKSPTYSSGYALRFPRITRLRPDRSVEDIASLHEVEKDSKKR